MSSIKIILNDGLILARKLSVTTNLAVLNEARGSLER